MLYRPKRLKLCKPREEGESNGRQNSSSRRRKPRRWNAPLQTKRQQERNPSRKPQTRILPQDRASPQDEERTRSSQEILKGSPLEKVDFFVPKTLRNPYMEVMEHFVYAGSEEGCGLASLKMMLARLQGDPNYRYLEEEGPFSLERLRIIAEREGIRLCWKKASVKGTIRNARSFPFILLFEEGTKTHAVYLFRRRGRKFFLFDPSKGKTALDVDQLLAKWNGVFAEGERFERHRSENKRPHFFTKIGVLSIFAFYAFALSSFLASFFFFEAQNPVYMTVAFLALGIIFSFLERRMVLLEMRRFDRRFLPRIYDNPKAHKDFESSFSLYQESKKNLFLRLRFLLECPLTCLSVLFLFGSNSSAFLIAGAVTLLLEMLLQFLFAKSKSRHAQSIHEGEKAFLRCLSSKKEGMKVYRSLLKKAEGAAQKEELHRALTVLCIALIAFIPPLLEGRIEINYYLFGLFGLLGLSESFLPGLTLLFDEAKKRKECYFNHFFSLGAR